MAQDVVKSYRFAIALEQGLQLAIVLDVGATMRTSQHLEKYRGFQIVANFWKGQFQAIGRVGKKNEIEIKNAASVDDAVIQCRKKIDEIIRKNPKVFEKLILGMHKSYLEKIGADFSGLILADGRPERKAKCFNCHTIVDSVIDYKCGACGWIICTHCGACGCGYKRESKL